MNVWAEVGRRRARLGRHMLFVATLIAVVSLPVTIVARDWPAVAFFAVAVIVGGSSVYIADRADARSRRKQRFM